MIAPMTEAKPVTVMKPASRPMTIMANQATPKKDISSPIQLAIRRGRSEKVTKMLIVWIKSRLKE